jgi:uncharacterized protein DUF5648
MGHLYTSNAAEADAATATAYESEGIAGFVFKEHQHATMPLFRADHAYTRRHVYTTDENEYNSLINGNWIAKGIECYVFADNIAGALPFYRMYNPFDGDHFYTTNPVERDAAAANLGYVFEGVEGFILPSVLPGTTELFRLLQVYDSYLRVNLIAVGGDSWTAAHQTVFNNGFTTAAGIFRQTGIRLRDYGQYFIPAAAAGGYLSVQDVAEATALTDDWTVPTPALDLFCVPSIPGAVGGWAPAPGPCDKNAKGMDGAVVERDVTLGVLGVVIAHEIGHYLGLSADHDTTPSNLMNAVASATNTVVTPEQAARMKKHCFVWRYY